MAKEKQNKIQNISILGAGWLGLPLGQRLVEAGKSVRASSTRKERLETITKAGMQAYLLALETLEAHHSDFFECDLLFINIPPPRKLPNLVAVYTQWMEKLLVKISAHKIPYCIFISSTGVYPDLNDTVDESIAPVPESTSGKALFQSETLLKNMAGLQCNILRLAGLVGGSREPGKFLAGKQNLANGDAPVNLVHRADCIAIICQIINKGIWGETFNICADKHPSRADFYVAQAKKLTLEPPTFSAERLNRFKIISNQKIKNSLSYQFQYADPMNF